MLWWLIGLALAQPEASRLEITTQEMFQAFESGQPEQAVELARQARAIAVALYGRGHDQAVTASDNLAFLLQATGDFHEALALLEATLAMRTQTLQPGDPRLATALNNVGFLYVQLGDLEQALPLLEQATEQHRVSGDLEALATALNNLAFVYGQSGRGDEGVQKMRGAVEATRALMGEEDVSTAATLLSLVELQLRTGHLEGALAACDEAALLLQRSGVETFEDWVEAETKCAEVELETGEADGIARMERLGSTLVDTLGRSSPTYALYLQYLSLHLQTVGDMDRAHRVSEEALERARSLQPVNLVLLAQAQNNLGAVLVSQGQAARAETLLQAALDSWERTTGLDTLHVARCRMNLGVAQSDQGKLHAARQELLASLALIQNLRGDPEYAIETLSALGHVEGELGLNEQARGRLEWALRMARGLEHPQLIASVLNNLGNQTYARGDEQRALTYFQEAIELWTQREHPNFAILLGNAGLLYVQLGQQQEGWRLLEASMALQKHRFGDAHPVIADVLSQQASAASETGDHTRGLQLEEQALAMRGSLLPAEHPDVGASMAKVALYLARLDRPEATEMYAEAIRRLRSALGERHPAWPPLQADWAEHIRAQGDPERALRLLDEAVQLQLANLPQLMEGASEREQLRLLQQQRRTLDRELAWRVDGDQRPVWQHLLAWKGIVRQGLRWHAVLSDSDPSLIELREVRRQLARLSLSPVPMEGTEARRAELDALFDRRAQLQRTLSLAPEAPPTVTEVQQALGPGEVLVDVIQLARHHDEVLAFIISRESVRRVSLGSAQELDVAVAHWRTQVSRGRSLLAIEQAGRSLRKRVWDPLGIEAPERVWWVPDGSLSLVSIGALLGEDGVYLAETAIHTYLDSPAELVRTPSQPGSGALVVGGVDLDAQLAATAALDSDRPAPCRTRYAPLAGSLEEAKAVSRWARRLRLGSTDLLTGAAATEDGVASLASGRRLLHLATHGFAADPECKAATSSRDQGNPWVWSGLVLAGANQPTPPGGQDGIWTAEEVAALDLRGTELVVLSACGSGVGDIVHGDGVTGLRRGVAVAGASSLVMSLWSVPDEPTRELMEVLYRELARSKQADVALALHQAQRTIIARQRREFGFVRPRDWAGFVMSGRGVLQR